MAKIKSIIREPLITEKATLLRDEQNCYTFVVDSKANSIEIKKAIEKKFGVKVLSVRTITVHGKTKKSLGRRQVNKKKTSDWKKAIVKLKEGDKIEVFEGV